MYEKYLYSKTIVFFATIKSPFLLQFFLKAVFIFITNFSAFFIVFQLLMIAKRYDMNPAKIKLLGILGILVIFLCCALFKTPEIEADLSARTFSALKNKGIEIPGINVNGRDVVLTGIVKSDEIRKRAEKIAAGVYGVNKVINNLRLIHTPLPQKQEGEIKKLKKTLSEFSAENIEFKTGSAVIRKKSYPVLDRLVSLLKQNPEVKIEIEGHTDSQGNSDFNLKLSQHRAEAVKKYLTEHGIKPERLFAKGFGSSRPIADNKTEEGRKKNRRVEFKIHKEK